jgi:hypothetical protein
MVDIKRATVIVAGSEQHQVKPFANSPRVIRLPCGNFEYINESDIHWVFMAEVCPPPNRVAGVISVIAKLTPATVSVDLPDVGVFRSKKSTSRFGLSYENISDVLPMADPAVICACFVEPVPFVTRHPTCETEIHSVLSQSECPEREAYVKSRKKDAIILGTESIELRGPANSGTCGIVIGEFTDLNAEM